MFALARWDLPFMRRDLDISLAKKHKKYLDWQHFLELKILDEYNSFQEQLLQQALQVVLNGHVSFGYVLQAKEIIRMKSLLIKSEQQKESVRTSPEFLRSRKNDGSVNLYEFYFMVISL